MRKASYLTLGSLVLSAVLLSNSAGNAQKQDNRWLEWTQKDAEKVLSDSGWAQTQTDTDTSEMFYSPTSDPRRMGSSPNDSSRLGQGATNQSINVTFHVRFFSARPIRRALARIMELQQRPDGEMTQRLHNFAEMKSPDSIILTLSAEASDQRYGGVVMQALNSAVTATLKNDTYLERNGKRLFLEEYVPPGRDGFGARFIFQRHVDGQQFISGNTGDVRFFTKYPNGLKVDRVFKLSGMMLDGELEY